MFAADLIRMKQYSSLIERRDETRGKSITFVPVGGLGMGQLAFIKMFLLVSIPTDISIEDMDRVKWQ